MQTRPLQVGRTLDRLRADRLAAGVSRIPLFHAAWMFAAGIALSRWVGLRPSVVLLSLTLAAVLCVLAALRAQRIVWMPMALLWCLLGAWCALMEPQPAAAPELSALSDGLIRTVEGTVVDAAPLRAEREENLDDSTADASERPSQRVDLRVSTLELVTDDLDTQTPVSGGIRLTVRWPVSPASASSLQSMASTFHCGDKLRAQVRLLPPETFHDPDVFSRQNYLLDQGITSVATVNVDQLHIEGESEAPSLACRLRAGQRLSTAHLLALPAAMRRMPAPLRLTASDAAMLAAMVAGDRTYLTHSLRAGFERTGSFHMLVVSGFHLAIVAGCIFFFARGLHVPQVPSTLLTIGVSFAYALFTGFATPVQRSLWMVTLYLLARLVYRDRSPLNTIGFAALCLLAASPRSLFDAGLQMTLLAVVVIAGVAAPLLENTVHPYINATRDLRLLAIDATLPPSLGQFRVTLRMMADGVRSLVRAYMYAPIDPEAATPESEPPPETVLQAELISVQPAPRKSAESLAGRLLHRVSSWSWRLVPFSVRWSLRFVELVTVSCVVELAMTLPMALYFHRITLFALPVNLFILPLLTLIMPAALVTLVVALIWPAAAVVPAIFVALPLHFGIWLVHLFGSRAVADFRIPAPRLIQSLAFCALLAAAMVLARGRGSRGLTWQRRAAWAALGLAAFAAVAPQPIQHPHGALLMEAIDVGQGDSILLITPGGKTLLIDAGGYGGGPHQAPQDFDIGEEVVSEALWSRGIRRLDAVALTHAHSDHMGGMPAVLRNFHPAELWVGNNPHFAAYDALLAEAASLHIGVRSLRAGDALSLGAMHIAILAPFRNYQPGPEPTNNDSLVMRASYGATSVLLEGDAEAPVEQAMLAEPDLESTLLKVGHHGSITSTRPDFLARVAPQWAVISCGLHNRYHHPRPEVLEALEAAKVRTFSTDINGAVCFQLNGKTVNADAACGWQPHP
jgi:competence protein ComEC